MEKERMPHDSAYKQFFSNPEMVESLLRDFVPADFVADLDFSTLERCSGSYVTDDLRERHDDIVWRVGWKKGSWCYVALLLEFQSTPDHWMALRTLSYTSLLLLDLVKTGKVREGEGLPPVFPIVIYNGGKVWKAPQDVAALFAPMPESLKYYRPQHRYFFAGREQCAGRRAGQKQRTGRPIAAAGTCSGSRADSADSQGTDRPAAGAEIPVATPGVHGMAGPCRPETLRDSGRDSRISRFA